jgi:hypothetical protein
VTQFSNSTPALALATVRVRAAPIAAPATATARRMEWRCRRMREWTPRAGFNTMYTDWTAVILLLLTAAPLAAVVATTAFFIWRQKQKQARR